MLFVWRKRQPMRQPDGMSRSDHLFFEISSWVVRTILKIFFRLRVSGTENVPMTGGVILASNHASFIDPPLVGSTSPRITVFFAKKELFKLPIIGAFITKYNAIPVDRGGVSKQGIKLIIQSLKNGRVVGLFPEGTRTRTGKFGPVRSGVGMMAHMTGVPVVPTYIKGTYQAARHFRISIHFGKPISPDDYDFSSAKTRKDAYLGFSQKIMDEIVRMEKQVRDE